MASLPPPRNILIFGATGVIGTFITEAIVSAMSNFGRIAIFTSASTLEKKAAEITKLKDAKVEVFVGDIADVGEEGAVRQAFEGIDTVLSCLGRSTIHLQLPLLRLAATTPSITRFYPSEYGTDIAYSPSSATEKPHQQKLKVRGFIEHELETKKAESEGKVLEITYLVTGPFADMYLYPPVPGNEGAGGFDVKARKAYVIGDGEGRVSLTSMRDVGALLVGSLLHSDPEHASSNSRGVRVRTLKVNSFTTFPLEIVREFEHQTGRKWEVEYTPLEEVKAIESQKWEQNDPMATLWTLKRIWAEGGTLYERRDNERVGELKVQGLAEAVRRALGPGLGGEEKL